MITQKVAQCPGLTSVQFFPDDNPNAFGFAPNVCEPYYAPLIKIMQRNRCLLSLHLRDNSWYLNDLPGASMSFSFEFYVEVCSHAQPVFFFFFLLRLFS